MIKISSKCKIEMRDHASVQHDSIIRYTQEAVKPFSRVTVMFEFERRFLLPVLCLLLSQLLKKRHLCL